MSAGTMWRAVCRSKCQFRGRVWSAGEEYSGPEAPPAHFEVTHAPGNPGFAAPPPLPLADPPPYLSALPLIIPDALPGHAVSLAQLKRMNRVELRAYADTLGITFTGAVTRTDMITQIVDVEIELTEAAGGSAEDVMPSAEEPEDLDTEEA